MPSSKDSSSLSFKKRALTSFLASVVLVIVARVVFLASVPRTFFWDAAGGIFMPGRYILTYRQHNPDDFNVGFTPEWLNWVASFGGTLVFWFLAIFIASIFAGLVGRLRGPKKNA
jgi:hypothetical protein